MDYSNYKNILSLTTNKEEQNKVKLLLEAAGQPISEVPDPYYDDNGFEYVFELIDSACTILANKLTKFKED